MSVNVTHQTKKTSTILVTSQMTVHWMHSLLRNGNWNQCRKIIKNKLDCFQKFKKLILTKKINSNQFATYLLISSVIWPSSSRPMHPHCLVTLGSCIKRTWTEGSKTFWARLATRRFNCTDRKVFLLLRNLYFVNSRITLLHSLVSIKINLNKY